MISTSSAWPLPATPATPKIFAGPDIEGDALDDLVSAVVTDMKVLDLQDRARRVRDASVYGELDLPADHELSQVLLIRLGRVREPTTRPRRMTVMRSAISSTS